MRTGARYLGGYIRDDETKGDWIKERMEKLERDSCALIRTDDNYSQESYSTVARAVQLEWTFLKRVKNDTGQAFTGLVKVIHKTFLPRLFYGKLTPLPNRKRSKYVFGKEIRNGIT